MKIFLNLKRSLLRQTLRGAIKLKNKKEKTSLSELNHIAKNYKFTKKAFSNKHFFGKINISTEIVTRQYLIIRFLQNQNFIDASFRYKVSKIKFFIFGIPSEWQKILFPNNNKISRFLSSFLWYSKVIIYLCNGIIFILKTITLSLVNIIRSNQLNEENFIFFLNLSDAGFPFFYDIHSKKAFPLHEKLCVTKSLKACTILYGPADHQLKLNKQKLKYRKNTYIYFDNIKKLLQFVSWSILSVGGALKDLIKDGDWVRAIMIKEASQASIFRFNNAKTIANAYYFNNSNLIYRPLWTYEAEKKGSEILAYFYSTGNEPYKTVSVRNSFTSNFFEIMTWSKYLVWDKAQFEFLDATICNAGKFEIIGPIVFKNSALKNVTFRNNVVLFDILPQRYLYSNRLGIDFDYITYKINKAFLKDCLEVTKKNNLPVVLKSKRKLGHNRHKGYLKLIKDLKVNGLKEINNEIFIIDLIQNSSMVISFPYTSTSRIAKALGVPTVYYDPTGKLFNDDPAARGIKIINKIEDLHKWVFQNCNKT